MIEANDVVVDAGSVSAIYESQLESARLDAESVSPSALGDLGGALSWPMPLSTDQQNEVLSAVQLYIEGLDELWKPGQQLLEHLYLHHPLDSKTLGNPAKALETLVASARGQALGMAVQTRLKGISTDVSITEYALAAIHLNLDPLSIENTQRNSVAGFDLASRQHWGKPVSAVFNKLREHLIKELISGPEMAGLGAYALLARNAPLFLIKDIPDGVKYGSAAWFNLAVAAATIEAQCPGKLANMTFAQVMICAESAAMTDPAVTRYAQTIALIDWGVVHVAAEKKDDERYTEVELGEIKEQFNAQFIDRLNTPVLLKSVFSSRQSIALAGLEKEFGKDFPFEHAALEWDSSLKVLSHLAPVPSDVLGPQGKYSLLDVAMIDGNYRWKSSDKLLNAVIHDINELNLRVRETFRKQFATTLSNLKEGARLTVKHLISELPLEDRENLEYGKIDFYQHKTYKLSTSFFGRNLTYTSPTLTLRVERGTGKKVSVYHIDLGADSIKKSGSDPAQVAERTNVNVPSTVYTTEPFYVADESVAAKLKQGNETQALPPKSYSSERTLTIADAFVEHLDYDSEKILNAAQGQTTYDKELAAMKSRMEFLLNLIPFKSAITHFVEGNYVDGAIDLFLDVLGFVTAGVGAAAKLAQVGARTASAISKALKVAKIIGAVVIGELNPVSGIAAGVQLLGRGIKFVGVKGLHQLNRLRASASGYDLLLGVTKAHGPTVLGTFKVGEQSIEGVGVLKNDSWYPYNLDTRRLYGPPGNFTPQRFCWGGTLGGEANSRIYLNFHNNVEFARNRNNLRAFERGYTQGNVIVIDGYTPGMKFDELIELVSEPGLKPEEIGALTKEIKTKILNDARYSSNLLAADLKGLAVEVVPVSQGHYLAHVNMVSRGECAGLSNAMAYAIHHGNEDILLKNIPRAALAKEAPGSTEFICDMTEFHNTVNNKESFHMGAAKKKMDADEIIDALESSPDSKTLRLASKDHAMLAGIRVRNGRPEWFFYEPNSGFAKFSSPESMRQGMHKVLESGALAATLNTYGRKRGGRDFNVSEFDPADIDNSSISRNRVENLSSVELPDPEELVTVQTLH